MDTFELPPAGAVPDTASQVAAARREASNPKAKSRAEGRKRQATWKARHLPGKLKATQAENSASLSADQREALQNQQAEYADLMLIMADCMKGVSEGRIAGTDLVWPDCTYRMVKQFIDRTGLVRDWVPDVEFLTLIDAESFERFDDQNFIRYGIRTRIPDFIFFEFCRYVTQWADANPGECDTDIEPEVRQVTKSRDNKPQMYDGPTGSYSQKELDRQQAEKYDFETELARFERERLENWDREQKQQALQGPIGFFGSQIGSGL